MNAREVLGIFTRYRGTDVIDTYTSIQRETALNRLKLCATMKLGISQEGNFGEDVSRFCL